VIVHAEAEFGFHLLERLKDTYATIGTGGFGPGYRAMRARTLMVHMSGTTGDYSPRMLKKPVQQGRSE
jgi:hypothetical protein